MRNITPAKLMNREEEPYMLQYIYAACAYENNRSGKNVIPYRFHCTTANQKPYPLTELL